MANEPMPWQMTIERLRELIQDVPENVVVALYVRSPGIGSPNVDIIYNLEAEYTGGPVFCLIPADVPPDGNSKLTAVAETGR